jgi:hypothetical protein
MGAAVENLKKLIDSDACYETPWKELLPRQIEAADELFQERVSDIKLLAHRAEETGVRKVRKMADIVPLLFAHTSYKSYPETWFTQGKWDRMGQWLNTLTTNRVPTIDTRNIKDVDDWVAAMAGVGHYLSCSSGTTGKCSIIPADDIDGAFVGRQIVQAMTWATGIPQVQAYKGIGLSPNPQNARIQATSKALTGAYLTSRRPFPGPPITVGQVSKMVALRRSIAEGTAKPGDIAAFEAISKEREKAMRDAVDSTIEAIIAARGEKLMLQGMLGTMWQITQRVRDRGYSGKDFNPENALITGGGTKGVNMPPDARQQIFETFNLDRKRAYQFYSMQEINTTMPRCSAGRYHVAPWLVLLVLNPAGDELIEPDANGEIEGRAAFLDMSLHGRWAGLITGDKITAHYGRCACGAEGPTVGDTIVRYSDLPGGDKITCAGSIDAYVRGAA